MSLHDSLASDESPVNDLAASELELTTGDLEKLRALAEPAERYWAERGSLAWA
jgi:hypothetical protein